MVQAKGRQPLTQLFVLSTPVAKGVNGAIGVTSLVYNPHVNELLALGLDKRVTYWSVNEKRVLKQLQAGYEEEVTAMALS